MQTKGKAGKLKNFFQGGFTLIEVLVAVTASTVILGGFLIAFSNLNQVSKVTDLDLAKIQQGNNMRMGITKALSGASHAVFRMVDNKSINAKVDMLYYYKYNDEDALTELGYFYIDQQRANGVNTYGVTAIFMFFDRRYIWENPSKNSTKSVRIRQNPSNLCTFRVRSPNPSKSSTFAVTPLVLTPLVRNQFVLNKRNV